MHNMDADCRYLVSLPPAAVRAFGELGAGLSRDWWAAGDPHGEPLGSAGGTVHLLRQAWRQSATAQPLLTWITERRTVVVHGSGQSRRLPAYAPVGKPMIPMPVLRGSYGQRLDQTLLDLQAEHLDAVIARSEHPSPLLIASGDVLTVPGSLPDHLPDADVVVLGIRADPVLASHFGVFVRKRGSHELLQSLQKPSPERLTAFGPDRECLLDVGLWVLGPRAIAALLSACLTDATDDQSPITMLDLYRDVGGALGSEPTAPLAALTSLKTAVVEITDGAFYHFGTSRQLIEATCALQNDSVAGGLVRGPRSHPDQILQNARVDTPTQRSVNHTLWIENSHIRDGWTLRDSHVLTGIPYDLAPIRLDPGVCIDCVPIVGGGVCVRPYGLDDGFSGPIGDPGTLWLGRPASEWFAARGLSPADAGLTPERDIHAARLFPVLPDPADDGALIEWMVAAPGAVDAQRVADASCGVADARAQRWLALRRLSSEDLLEQTCVASLQEARDKLRSAALDRIQANRAFSVFYRLDLRHAATVAGAVEPHLGPTPAASALDRMYDWAWIAARRRASGASAEEADEAAFAALREGILEHTLQAPTEPVRAVQSDQIVWARSPVRLDLAGGWTDTPPYCIVHGGAVTNVAVNLNGQPPVQCFVRVVDRHSITIHSIDRGEP
ncbi:MAG: hypothetical protein FJX72_11080, partial [Armatimonadetes bacterium]|nr:hypothetical protein [Armatimonadota bacterium]